MGKYPNFAACVAAQKKKGKSDESAHKICGEIKKRAEGKAVSEWAEKVLKKEKE